MKRIVSIVLAALAIMWLVSAEQPQSAFEAIQMSDTLESVTAMYGEGVSEGEYIIFGDALCAFYESGRLMAKSLIYIDVRDVAQETTADFALVRDMKQGASIAEIEQILGQGRDILFINLSDEEDSGQRKIVAWRNQDGGVMEALFELDSDNWILFALGEIE